MIYCQLSKSHRSKAFFGTSRIRLVTRIRVVQGWKGNDTKIIESTKSKLIYEFCCVFIPNTVV